jgi:hypothetical protein
MCFSDGGQIAYVPWPIHRINGEYVYQSIDGFLNLWRSIYLLPQASKRHPTST